MSALEKKLLHNTGRAIADYKMIQTGDKVLACLSGGKDSFTMINLLRLLKMRSQNKFSLFVLMVDAGIPGWHSEEMINWLQAKKLPHEILKQNIYNIVQSKSHLGSTDCMLCSRLRRGSIYTYAKKHHFVKIALGHHRDDLITSLLMSIFYNGEIRSMPPKMLTDDKRHIVIRPLVYTQEKDLAAYALHQQLPIISHNLCAGKESFMRKKIQALIAALAAENPKIPSNMLHALQKVSPSQLMDHRHWDFKNLEKILN